MPKKKKDEPVDPKNLKPEERMKFEIAAERSGSWPKETIIEMERKIFYNEEAAKAGIWREYAAESGRTDRE